MVPKDRTLILNTKDTIIRQMSFVPGFPKAKIGDFFDPPAIAWAFIAGAIFESVRFAIHRRHKIATCFEPRCLCIIQLSPHQYMQKAMRFSEARNYRNILMVEKQALSFQVINFQANLFDRFLFAIRNHTPEFKDE